jgi:hypothetical protein
MGNRCDSACAFELTRRVAGRSGAVHAGFAYINALTEVFRIKLLVTLGDASTLLIRILNFLRARRDADGYCEQNNEAWHLQGGAFGRMASHKMTSSKWATPQTSFTGTRSTSAMSLWESELVSPSSQEMVTSLQDAPTTVPKSLIVTPQQTRSSILSLRDWSPVIWPSILLALPD